MSERGHTISFASKVVVPDTVLFRELGGCGVLLNLTTESYLSLDDVGTRMWELLTAASSIETAFETLLAEFDVAPDVLRRDIDALLAQMVEHGLVTIESA